MIHIKFIISFHIDGRNIYEIDIKSFYISYYIILYKAEIEKFLGFKYSRIWLGGFRQHFRLYYICFGTPPQIYSNF